MSIIKIFKTPTKSKPNSAYIGIPKSIKNNPNIRNLQIVQTQILSPPKTVQDLTRVPVVSDVARSSGTRNMSPILALPGNKISIAPIGSMGTLLPPIEIEEVILPAGFVHIDDIEPWIIHNYNLGWDLSDSNFKTLPTSARDPVQINFTLVSAGKDVICTHSEDINEVRLFYRRIEDTFQDFDWLSLGTVDNNTRLILELEGKYAIRGIPYFDNYPLQSYKEIIVEFPETQLINYTYIQNSKSKFQFRIAGKLSKTINNLRIYEDGEFKKKIQLIAGSDGLLDKYFIVNNLSNVRKSKIEMRYYFKDAYHSRESIDLYRHTGKEPINLRVHQYSNGVFTIQISDRENKLYKPLNSIDPFRGPRWDTAVQTQELVSKLLIIRHQNGVKTKYGSFYINISGGSIPKFLDSPPFGSDISKVGRVHSFTFEDTQDFRNLIGVDTPDTNKSLSYEFRLQTWTAGIEHCLRTEEEYYFVKEEPVTIRNIPTLYKYPYNVWSQEHPKRRYLGVIPLGIEKANYNEHEIYGTSQSGSIKFSVPQPISSTTEITVSNKNWKVLYYYQETDDMLQQFPYYSFEINVPISTQYITDSIDVFLVNSSENILLGNYHPTSKISIVDFLGFYKKMKLQLTSTDLMAAIPPTLTATFPPILSTPPSIMPSTSQPNFPFSSSNRNLGRNLGNSTLTIPVAETNTPQQVAAIVESAAVLSNALVKTVLSGSLTYKIILNLRDNTQVEYSVQTQLSEVPEAPAEEEENLNLSIGNSLITSETFVIVPSLTKALTKTIISTPAVVANAIGRLI